MKTEVKSQFRLEPVVFHTLNTLFMLIVVIVTLYPFLHTMAISFNDGSDSLKGACTFGRTPGPCKIIKRYSYRARSITPRSFLCPVPSFRPCSAYF